MGSSRLCPPSLESDLYTSGHANTYAHASYPGWDRLFWSGFYSVSLQLIGLGYCTG